MVAESLSVGRVDLLQMSSAAAPKTRRSGHKQCREARLQLLRAEGAVWMLSSLQVRLSAQAWYSRGIGRCTIPSCGVGGKIFCGPSCF